MPMSTDPLTVVLAAGGTAGHVEPALNLADALLRERPDTRIVVLGSERGLEATLVPARGFELVTVPAVPMPRRPNGDLLLLPARLRTATAQAAELLRTRHADVVVGFGGYAAVPGYLAARRAKVPLVIHEANARPGLANRLGSRLTSHVYASVPGAMPRARYLALPLRHAISSLDRGARHDEACAHFGLDPRLPVLLVFGGSQGAQRLNAAVAGAVAGLVASGISVLHSYGSRNEVPAPVPPSPGGASYVALPYIDRMDLAYAAADFAVTRAGAMTCAELAAVGLPAAYVPLPIGNGEQRVNAEPVVSAGGGLLVDDSALTAEWLSSTVTEVLHDGGRLAGMSAAAAEHGVRDADEQLARIVIDAAGHSGRTADRG